MKADSIKHGRISPRVCHGMNCRTRLRENGHILTKRDFGHFSVVSKCLLSNFLAETHSGDRYGRFVDLSLDEIYSHWTFCGDEAACADNSIVLAGFILHMTTGFLCSIPMQLLWGPQNMPEWCVHSVGIGIGNIAIFPNSWNEAAWPEALID